MDREEPTKTLTQPVIFLVSSTVLIVTLVASFYFPFQMDLPLLLTITIALLIATLVVGPFYYVIKYQILS